MYSDLCVLGKIRCFYLFGEVVLVFRKPAEREHGFVRFRWGFSCPRNRTVDKLLRKLVGKRFLHEGFDNDSTRPFSGIK